MRQIINLKDHPQNGDKTAKLEWFEGDRSVYAVKEGFVAVTGYDLASMNTLCLAGTFPSKSEAVAASRAA